MRRHPRLGQRQVRTPWSHEPRARRMLQRGFPGRHGRYGAVRVVTVVWSTARSQSMSTLTLVALRKHVESI